MADVPLFPVTVVGSWPRPPELIQALRRRQADEISEDEFNAVADKAVIQALKEQEEAGTDIISDGEQRRDNFYSYVVGKIAGMQLMKVSAKDRAPAGGTATGFGRAGLRHQESHCC